MRSHDKLLQQFRVGAAAGHARESERGISSVFSLWLAPFALLQKKKMEILRYLKMEEFRPTTKLVRRMDLIMLRLVIWPLKEMKYSTSFHK